MPPIPDYKKMHAPAPVTRHTQSEPCKCDLCQVARTYLPQDTTEALSKIFQSTLPSSSKPPSSLKNKCSKCETLVGKGKSHKCTRESRIENISSIIKSSSKRTRHRILKEGLYTELDEVMFKHIKN